MKRYLFLAASFLLVSLTFAQKDPVAEISKVIVRSEAEAHLAFLASDELRGRDTGTPELDIAASYIATQFRILGLKQAPGLTSYFQPVSLETVYPASSGELNLGADLFKFKDHFIVMGGGNTNWTGEIVYAGYGSPEELVNANVKGKLVVALAGDKNSNGNVMAIFMGAGDKAKNAKANGAAGLVEIFSSPQVPWAALVNYLASNPSTRVKSKEEAMPHIWLKGGDAELLVKVKENVQKGSLIVNGIVQKEIPSKNVVGIIEGTDPALKNEYLVVSAHYDHVGVQKKVQAGKDSIFNGARDNAIGVVGLLSTAKYMAKFPPKRSVLFLALTAEEKGLLGSKYYSENPVIPLNKTVFNFNCDGAGYNDTSVTTIIGMERTTAEADLIKASSAFGLKATLDPVPEQNLYERSDNYNFAVKGVPAVNFAPGTKSFDAELMKYYHQPADEVGSLDFDYLVKYFRAYVYSNVLLATMPKAPVWKQGDKFEAEAKKLYSK